MSERCDSQCCQVSSVVKWPRPCANCGLGLIHCHKEPLDGRFHYYRCDSCDHYRLNDNHAFFPGSFVVMNDDRLGMLENPRGCYCGPKGEACWDISYVHETGGIQAHGGTFRLADEPACEHDYAIVFEEDRRSWENGLNIVVCSKCKYRREGATD
jgi:hypothetical protein